MVCYRHYETVGCPVRYPFGDELSYTTFATDGLPVAVTGDDTVTIRVTVTNTGDRTGLRGRRRSWRRPLVLTGENTAAGIFKPTAARNRPTPSLGSGGRSHSGLSATMNPPFIRARTSDGKKAPGGPILGVAETPPSR